ncbi:MAG: GHKL domain-containing protein, partial [Leptolyngbya sp. SIO4C5]|nr:GHKL domain-containing protein [Leptolyngbya sp. SIO4C5]
KPDLAALDSIPHQVFINLLSNAVDAIEESLKQPATHCSHMALTHQPQITIGTCLADSQHVMIEIADNGVGIAQEIQQRIFNPFFTTKSIGKGTGMGLSISYQIITEKHRGQLTCTSAVGQGTTFSVIIPLYQITASPSQAVGGARLVR